VKAIGWLAGIGTLLGGLVYMVVSLNRWEWNRALFFGLIVVIAEIGLATALVLRKLTDVQRARAVDPALLAVLRDGRPPTPDRFAWLKEASGRTNVFITFLVGGGVLLSALAWLIDRIASKTSTPRGEEQLAAELTRISYPRGGLLVDDVTVLAQDVPGADDAQIRMLLRRAGHA
jgi:MFS family permease